LLRFAVQLAMSGFEVKKSRFEAGTLKAASARKPIFRLVTQQFQLKEDAADDVAVS
jgi:hypothetical protein